MANLDKRLLRWLPVGTALLVIGLSASAQEAPASSGESSSAHHDHHSNAKPAKAVAPKQTQHAGDASIITIRYACSGPSATGGTCTATVSKSEFDALVRALDPKMSAFNRQSLAEEYSRVLIMAAEARRRSLDQSPEFATLLNFSRLQLLATRLVREITAKPPSVSPEEVEKHFLDHASEYEEVVLSRIFVPALPDSTIPGRTSAASRVQSIYERAVKGEDFSGLHREVNGQGQGVEPNVRIGPMRCRSLPEAHRQVCAMPPGSISAPLPDQLGHSIYRVESRHRVKLSEVREEIRTMLERQRLEREIHDARTPVSLLLDESYFGKPPSPEVAEQHGLKSPAANSPSPKDAHKHHQH